MQIEINERYVDELLERQFKKAIGEAVGAYLRDHPRAIELAIENELNDQINRKYFDIIQEKVHEMATDRVVKEVAERISRDIAQAYAEKYYD